MEVEEKPFINSNSYWTSLIVSCAKAMKNVCKTLKIKDITHCNLLQTCFWLLFDWLLGWWSCWFLCGCRAVPNRHNQDTTTEWKRFLAVRRLQWHLQRFRTISYGLIANRCPFLRYLWINQIISHPSRYQRTVTICAHGCSLLWRDRCMSHSGSSRDCQATETSHVGEVRSIISRSTLRRLQKGRLEERRISRLRNDNNERNSLQLYPVSPLGIPQTSMGTNDRSRLITSDSSSLRCNLRWNRSWTHNTIGCYQDSNHACGSWIKEHFLHEPCKINL